MADKKRIIHSFKFDKPFLNNGDKTHLSLVDAGANLQEVLVMKASEYLTNTTTRERYDDEGNRVYNQDTVEVVDYGNDYVHITERKVQIVDYSVKK